MFTRCPRLRDGRRDGDRGARGGAGGVQRGGACGQAAAVHARVATSVRAARARAPARHRRHRVLADETGAAWVQARRVSAYRRWITMLSYFEKVNPVNRLFQILY